MENLPMVREERSVSLLEMEPQMMVENATKLANVLKGVIDQQHLYVQISAARHVKAEGWAALGTMMGILPREVEIKELSDGSYEAKVELINTRTGMIVGQASSLCSVTEKRWGNAEKYARRSMAITRATGKAYRLGVAWVVALAGYSGTPAEEMPREEEIPFDPNPKKPGIYSGTTEQQEKIVDFCRKRGVSEDLYSAIHERMIGRPSTDLNAIIKELKK
jgi:hypothetical protein